MSDTEAIASCPAVRRRVVGSNVWLLSFGDLVTLLLGFFVAIIAYAMQNPPKPAPKPPEAVQPGTTFANIPSGDATLTVRRTARVPEEGFDPVTGELSENWRNTLRAQLNPDDIRITESAVFGCIGSSGGEREQRRFAVMGRTLAVTGQVLDMGAPEKSLRVETPGEVCEEGITPGAVLVTITGRQTR